MPLSLLQLADHSVADWWLVFRNLPDADRRSWFWRVLKPGFQHVEIWRCDTGLWIRVEPCMELIGVEVHVNAPWDLVPPRLSPTFLRVQRAVKHQRLREPCFFGPWTCVEITKAFIGVRASTVRTPWQLYRYLKKNNG